MKSFAIALPIALLSAVSLLAGPVNLNSPVTLNGSFPAYVGPYGNLCGVGAQPQGSAGSLDDGAFLPEGTCYQSGPVYWNTQTNTIDIDLQGTFTLNGAIVQADDNDVYTLQYEDIAGTYHDWWNVPALGSFGMITRPGSPDQGLIQALPEVQAIGLRLFAPIRIGRRGVCRLRDRGLCHSETGDDLDGPRRTGIACGCPSETAASTRINCSANYVA